MTRPHPEPESQAALRRPIDYLAIEKEARRLRAEAFRSAVGALARRVLRRPARTPDGKLA